MKISFSAQPTADIDLSLLAVDSKGYKNIDGPHKDALKAVLAANPDFKGEAGEVVCAVVPGKKAVRVGLLGLGEPGDRSASALEVVGGKLAGALIALPVNDVHVRFGPATRIDAAAAAALASGAALRAYEFRRYRTKNKDNVLPDTLTFEGGARERAAFAPLYRMAQAVHWARDLANEPPNILYPESMAKRVAAALRPLRVKVQIFDDKALIKKGFGALIAVGQASEHLPRLVVLEYKGPKAPRGRPIAMVGKGITFDSGGYSIKTGEGMIDMKLDMSGAAAVAGAMMALAANKAPVHVVAALALAENMISDEGYRPGDILTSLSGQTVEITNTDAEGRLVLADALWYIQETYKPRAVVDIATLTGAAMVALGEEYAALFGNDDALLKRLGDSGASSGEKIWPMPLDPAFDRAIDSPVADMKNAAATRMGGSCTGAAFLKRYIQKGVAWAHIDMAPVMSVRADTPLCPRGATGFGVRLLYAWAGAA